MDIAWMEDFLELATHRNFTRAAAARNISQAAFSRRIKALEAWLGARLVDRTTIPVRLTPEGERFAREAAVLLEDLGEMRARLAHPGLGHDAGVRIAMPHMLAVSRFPAWWGRWAAGMPVRVNASVGSVSDIISDFVSGGSDIMICHRGSQLPLVLDPELFEMQVIERDTLSPCVSRIHFPHLRNEDQMRAAEPLPLVLYGRGTYFARLVEQIIAGAPGLFAGRRRVECNIAHTLRECVARGMGLGWLPESIIEGRYRERLAILQEPQWRIGVDVVAFTHKHGLSPAGQLIWQRIRAAGAPERGIAAPAKEQPAHRHGRA